MKIFSSLIFVFLSYSTLAQNMPITQELIQRLKNTKATNLDEVINDLGLIKDSKASPTHFKIANPYSPSLIKTLEASDRPREIKGIRDYKELRNGSVLFFHQNVVHEWGKLTPSSERNAIVCAFKFIDDSKTQYQLQTFSSKAAAESSGFIVTHQNRCGACSSLQDLAIFLEIRDMTGPGRICTKKSGLYKMMECTQKLGLTRECSEAWAYNSQHTKKVCMKTCVKDYGLLNVLQNKYPGENIGRDGILRPCLLCDEVKSGLAYKYVTGRSRRSSGIVTDIERDNAEMYSVDYRKYYEEFNLNW